MSDKLITKQTIQTLLIVDDDTASLDVLSEIFEQQYRVLVANNGREALSVVGRVDLDLILLDVDMPGMNGFEACRLIKQSPKTEHIPIIFVTGRGSGGYEVEGLNLGAIDYVTKPYNLPALQLRVQNHMQLGAYRRALETASTIDGLTGIANRMQLNRVLEREWHLAQRRRESISVIMIDVDDFKLYNDTYGHLAGDECLKRIAEAIESYPRRPNDLVGRYGGEEFLVVLPNTNREGSKVVAECIQRAVRSQCLNPEGKPSCKGSVSMGAATYRPSWDKEISDRPWEELVREADINLYRAKQLGKNQVCYQQASAEELP